MEAWQQVVYSPWIVVPAVFALWVMVWSLAKKTAFAVARKLAARTATQVDDVLFAALDFPLQLMIYATGVLVVQHFIPKGEVDITRYLAGGFKAIAIFAVALFIDKFLRGLVGLNAHRMDILRTSGGFVRGLIRVVVMGMAALVALDSLGVSITPLIASLGIGSLAVALALQPTLENFFSGIQLIVDKPIQVNHYIRLESGEEGMVQRIGWRSTWILLPNSNTIVIPNKLLVNSRVTNFYYPDAEIVVPVALRVPYATDLDRVERLTLEVAREVQREAAGAVIQAEPSLRFTALGESGVELSVALRARDFPSGAGIKHEFIKRLLRRYAQEGIVIPYPTRTIVQAH